MSTDVVVVGCGVAGMAAAVAAAEQGLRVTVLERVDESERGGNSRYTSAWMRMSNEDEISDDLVDLLVERGHGAIPPDFAKEATRNYADWPSQLKAYAFTDPELVSALAENASATMHWLKSHGIKFTTYEPMLLETGAVRMGPSGGGLAVIDALGKSAERLGVRFLYHTTARSLLQNAGGDVGGVRCWSKAKGLFDLECQSVVIASGGFQGNVEMMTRYAGANAVFARPVSAGGINNKGEGLEMMLAVGAAPAGQYDMFHGAPIDPRSVRAEAIVGAINFGILVNSQGRRFIDEGTNTYEHFYDEVAWTIMRQKQGLAYLLFDGSLFDIPHVRSRIQTEVEPVRAESITSLAQALSLPAEAVTKTLRDYNAATRPGSFDARRRDALCTELRCFVDWCSGAWPVARSALNWVPKEVQRRLGGSHDESRCQRRPQAPSHPPRNCGASRHLVPVRGRSGLCHAQSGVSSRGHLGLWPGDRGSKSCAADHSH